MGVREDVLAALDAEALTHAEIVESTSLTEKQVTNALNNAKAAGQCKRIADGWIRIDGSAEGEQPAPPVNTASTPRKPRAEKVQPNTAKAAKRARAKAAPQPMNGGTVAVAGNGELQFVLTERRELGIERPGVPRGVLSASEALRLADFLAMVRPALEAKV